ncbi:NAD-binding protein [Fusibacter bizertensis]|uniref:NAD-binding protein n=1 Tax=Fusibacter bizertensis TaxID=1488331 RepID=A0ABT6NEZ6_9FIRM|nr:NAD-binding protein [Fusibacter bizertensis]MDH8678990.1 NAD-binding protein [Fusibacter bizertensis]
MKKHAVLIGSFNRARSLADSLINKGYRVTAINSSYDKSVVLAENREINVINGDGSKPFVLDDANIEYADLAIVLTPKDEDNLVICQLCKKKFKVKKTISILNDPLKSSLFYMSGVDSVICEVNAITNIIEQQAFYDGIVTMIPTGEGKIRIAEVPILESSPVVGKKMWEINLPKESVIGCIIHGEGTTIPRGDTRINCGDKLILISAANQEMNAIKELTGRL